MTAGGDPGRSGRSRAWWRRGLILLSTALLATVPVGTARAEVSHEYASTLSFTVNGIAPIAVTAAGGNQFAIRGSVTNTGKQTVGDLQYIAQRGDPLSGVAAVREELDHPGEPETVITQKWRDFGAALAPGQSEPFTVTIGVVGDTLDTLAVEQRGVYPVMFNVNGDLADPAGGDSFHARVGELHTLLVVLSLPGTPATTLDPQAGPTVTPTAFSEVWPVVDRPHLGVDGLFLDDDLAASISAGGRLDAVLAALETNDPGSGAVTLEIDPELLDELDQMADGYRVLAADQRQGALAPTTLTVAPSGSGAASPSPSPSRTHGDGGAQSDRPGVGGGSPHPAATPSPTGTSGGAAVPTGPVTVAGRGSAAAGAYLDRLRQAVRRHRVLLLPYGDPDVLAMAGLGQKDEVAALVTRGRAVAARVLPGMRATDTADPYLQQADPATLAALAGAGYRSTILSAGSIQRSGQPAGAATVTADGGVSLPAALTDADVLTDLTQASLAGSAPDRMRTRTAVAALAAAAAFTGGGSPVVLVQDRRWTPGLAPAVVAPLLRVLLTAGIWRGTDPARVAGGAAETAAVAATPAPGASPPLSPGYLGRVGQDQQWVTRLRGALVATEPSGSTRVDPASQLDPLDEALSRTFCTAWRADPGGSAAVLATVEDTVTGLRQGVTIRSGGHLTLASGSSPLLVTVQNTLPYAVKVRLVIRGGDAVGLRVTQPELQEIPAGRAVPIRVPTQVSRSGTFAVTADLVAPDGTTWSDPGQPTRLTVSSSAYGAVTIIVVVVAGVVLLLMVIWRISQRIRGRGDPEAGAPAPPVEQVA